MFAAMFGLMVDFIHASMDVVFDDSKKMRFTKFRSLEAMDCIDWS
jgi:hypothetical protein